MPRFLFDSHKASSATWKQDGVECANAEEIEAHAHMVARAEANRHDRGDALVTVRNLDQSVVMTARLTNGEIAFAWNGLPDNNR